MKYANNVSRTEIVSATMEFVIRVDDDFTFNVYDEEDEKQVEETVNISSDEDSDSIQIKQEIEDVDIEENYLEVDYKLTGLTEIKTELEEEENEEDKELEILPFDVSMLELDSEEDEIDEIEYLSKRSDDNSSTNMCEGNMFIISSVFSIKSTDLNTSFTESSMDNVKSSKTSNINLSIESAVTNQEESNNAKVTDFSNSRFDTGTGESLRRSVENEDKTEIETSTSVLQENMHNPCEDGVISSDDITSVSSDHSYHTKEPSLLESQNNCVTISNDSENHAAAKRPRIETKSQDENQQNVFNNSISIVKPSDTFSLSEDNYDSHSTDFSTVENKENVPYSSLKNTDVSKPLIHVPCSEQKTDIQDKLRHDTSFEVKVREKNSFKSECKTVVSNKDSKLSKVPLSVSTVISESSNKVNKVSSIKKNQLSKINTCRSLVPSSKPNLKAKSIITDLGEKSRNVQKSSVNRLNSHKKMEFSTQRQVKPFKLHNSTWHRVPNHSYNNRGDNGRHLERCSSVDNRYRRVSYSRPVASQFSRHSGIRNWSNNNCQDTANMFNNNSVNYGQNYNYGQVYNIILNTLNQLVQQNCRNFMSWNNRPSLHNQYCQNSLNSYRFQQRRNQTFRPDLRSVDFNCNNRKQENGWINRCGMNFSESSQLPNIQQNLAVLQNYSTMSYGMNQLNYGFVGKNPNVICNNVTVLMSFLNVFGSH